MPERGASFRRQRIDQLVRLAGLHHLAALDMAAVAKFCQFPINLLVVSLPEESNGVVERLGELIARHRTFGQAGKDCVTKRHDAGLRLSELIDIMHKVAYASTRISSGEAHFPVSARHRPRQET